MHATPPLAAFSLRAAFAFIFALFAFCFGTAAHCGAHTHTHFPFSSFPPTYSLPTFLCRWSVLINVQFIGCRDWVSGARLKIWMVLSGFMYTIYLLFLSHNRRLSLLYVSSYLLLYPISIIHSSCYTSLSLSLSTCLFVLRRLGSVVCGWRDGSPCHGVACSRSFCNSSLSLSFFPPRLHTRFTHTHAILATMPPLCCHMTFAHAWPCHTPLHLQTPCTSLPLR